MLNKQSGNMYGFVTHTWNTIKGRCPHNCSYCYCKKWGEQKPIRFDEKELKTDLGKDNFIFVGSSCDLFADVMELIWIGKTLIHCLDYKDNTYLFQTKNPKEFKRFIFPPKTILCTTIESNRDLDKNNAPLIRDRVDAFSKLQFDKKMLTIEPIMDFDLKEFADIIVSINPIQVNIGADSGRNNLKEPTPEKIKSLIEVLTSAEIKVFLKDNLKRLLVYEKLGK